ncbi:GNAT family N-acetyltransferase [Metabacillus fastidiosus]|uniref:GNAT family N-acetyltransferase n=1 Tax=Metabacillus fastidiosus TaxID=1458 RepID=UPI002E1B56C3|nr:GNAT family N-acetyltransferase [Metabacillus fastidiosus]
MNAVAQEIKEINLEKDWKNAFPLIKQLQPELNENSFYQLINEMIPQGYKIVGLYVEEKIVAIAGFSIVTNLYFQRHLWLYDLVTDHKQRSKGYGKVLLDYLQDFAEKKECGTIALCSRFDRTEAHRFYTEKMGYEKTSYVIKRNLRKLED